MPLEPVRGNSVSAQLHSIATARRNSRCGGPTTQAEYADEAVPAAHSVEQALWAAGELGASLAALALRTGLSPADVGTALAALHDVEQMAYERDGRWVHACWLQGHRA
jgi:hypothetical protein